MSPKREMNNRYAKYLVAYFPESPKPLVQPEPPIQENPSEPADAPIWSRMLKSVQALVKQDNRTSTEQESSIAGYLGVWFQGNEAHITEIAVRETSRGQGIGELLLIGSLHAALEYGSAVVTLEARVSNFVAHRLYEKYGFKSAGVRKGYYADNREDAVIMTTCPINTEEYGRKFKGLQETYTNRWGEIQFDG